MKWSTSAEALKAKYLAFKGAEAAKEEADVAEVTGDLADCLEQKAAESGEAVISADVLEQIIREMGDGDFLNQINDEVAVATEATSKNEPTKGAKSKGVFRRGTLFFFAVILPLLTFGVELFFNACANIFFNPMPSVWLGALIVTVPLINAWNYFQLKDQGPLNIKRMVLLNGVSMGISFVYMLYFMPLMPFAIIGLLVGFGLLPLSPFCAFLAGFRIHRWIKLSAPNQGLSSSSAWLGWVLGIGLVLAGEAQFWVTSYGMRLVASDNTESYDRGVQLLRTFGSEDYIKGLYFYPHTGSRPYTDAHLMMFGRNDELSSSVSKKNVQRCYFLMTGEQIGQEDAPFRAMRMGGRWDASLGNLEVGDKQRNLWIHSSTMDGSLDTDAALGYLEWTVEFKNSNEWGQKEARALIDLPEGGVVSRLTLWVNDEPQEAAFAGKREVVEAYQNVVRRRLDPVLVTEAGENRVLMQCFPVPPKGGIMKVRLGITFPLTIETLNQAQIQLPRFNQTNFYTRPNFFHNIWLESENKLWAEHGASSYGEENGRPVFRLTNLPDTQFKQPLRIFGERDAQARQAFSADLRNPGFSIQQDLQKVPLKTIHEAVILVDDSAPMAETHEEMIRFAKLLPQEGKYTLFVASKLDGPLLKQVDQLTLQNALADLDFAYGYDNAVALQTVWDWCYDQGVKDLFWLNRTQIFKSPYASTLEQRLNRGADKVTIHSLPLKMGAGLLIKQLRGKAGFELVNSSDGAVSAWQRLFLNAEKQFVYTPVRQRLNEEVKPTTSSHLARLWAKDEIGRLLKRKTTDVSEPIKLAQHYQLVTPVSGAVVLESAEQFKEAGLDQVDADSVPTIPEPEEWLLIILSAVILAVYWKKNQQKRRAA